MKINDVLLFDSINSIIHFACGFIASTNKALALIITTSFIAFQLIEKEKYEKRLGDVIEYMCGFITGYIIK